MRRILKKAFHRLRRSVLDAPWKEASLTLREAVWRSTGITCTERRFCSCTIHCRYAGFDHPPWTSWTDTWVEGFGWHQHNVPQWWPCMQRWKWKRTSATGIREMWQLLYLQRQCPWMPSDPVRRRPWRDWSAIREAALPAPVLAVPVPVVPVPVVPILPVSVPVVVPLMSPPLEEPTHRRTVVISGKPAMVSKPPHPQRNHSHSWTHRQMPNSPS